MTSLAPRVLPWLLLGALLTGCGGPCWRPIHVAAVKGDAVRIEELVSAGGGSIAMTAGIRLRYIGAQLPGRTTQRASF